MAWKFEGVYYYDHLCFLFTTLKINVLHYFNNFYWCALFWDKYYFKTDGKLYKFCFIYHFHLKQKTPLHVYRSIRGTTGMSILWNTHNINNILNLKHKTCPSNKCGLLNKEERGSRLGRAKWVSCDRKEWYLRAGQTLLLIKISRPDQAPPPLALLPPRCQGEHGVRILLRLPSTLQGTGETRQPAVASEPRVHNKVKQPHTHWSYYPLNCFSCCQGQHFNLKGVQEKFRKSSKMFRFVPYWLFEKDNNNIIS